MALNYAEPYGGMTFTEAVAKACTEPTLADALTWIAVWETEQVVRQAKKYFETGISTASHGGGWDTCFKVCFKEVLLKYPKGYVPQPADVKPLLPKRTPEEKKAMAEVEAAMWDALAKRSKRKEAAARKRRALKRKA